MTDETVKVTQADRDRAAEFFLAAGWHGKGGSVKSGERDDEPLVQALARHRQQSEMSLERHKRFLLTKGWEERPFAFCCAEGGGSVGGCDCVVPNHGFVFHQTAADTKADAS